MAGKIEKDFEFLKKNKKILAVLLFGSQASKEAHKRSDIDICIVAPNENPKAMLKDVLRKINAENYDMHIFESLPLYIKMSVIENHKIIFSRDKYEMYEYFFFFRKLWEDQEHRQRMTKKELLEMIKP